MGLLGRLINKVLGCDSCHKCLPSITGADLMGGSYTDEEEDLIECLKDNEPCVTNVQDLQDATILTKFCDCINGSDQSDIQGVYSSNQSFKDLVDDFFAQNPSGTLCGHNQNYYQ